MSLRLSPHQLSALRVVAAGDVTHAHPFEWGVPIYVSGVPGIRRTLASLERKKLIRVIANAKAYWRPVKLTELGEKALREAASA